MPYKVRYLITFMLLKFWHELYMKLYKNTSTQCLRMCYEGPMQMVAQISEKRNFIGWDPVTNGKDCAWMKCIFKLEMFAYKEA